MFFFTARRTVFYSEKNDYLRANTPCDSARLLELFDEFGDTNSATRQTFLTQQLRNRRRFVTLGIKEEDTLLLVRAEHHLEIHLGKKQHETIHTTCEIKTKTDWERNDLPFPVWVWDDNKTVAERNDSHHRTIVVPERNVNFNLTCTICLACISWPLNQQVTRVHYC